MKSFNVFLYLAFFPRTLAIPMIPSERNQPAILLSTVSTCSGTLKHLVAVMLLTCLPLTFNSSTCNYQTVIQGDLTIFENSLHKKMKFSIKDFFSKCKCDQVRMKLRIWLNLLFKSLMKNFHPFVH